MKTKKKLPLRAMVICAMLTAVAVVLDRFVPVVFTDSLKVTLTFVPVRENGVAVRNTCLLSVDVTTTPGSGFVQQLAGNLADTLNERYRLAGLPLEVKWDGAGAMPMARVETQQKAVPDMRLFVRHIERKYQQ